MKILQLNSGTHLRQSRDSEEVLVARSTDNPDEQLRIAKNSKDRRILRALVINENIEDKTVQELFKRDIPEITRSLERLGFVKERSLFGLF